MQAWAPRLSTFHLSPRLGRALRSRPGLPRACAGTAGRRGGRCGRLRRVAPAASEPSDAVVRHLADWVGGWPPARPVRVVPDPEPDRPAWDGGRRTIGGVADSCGRAVLRVPPEVAGRLAADLPDVPALLAALPDAVGRPGVAGAGALRWAQDVPGPDELPEAGIWLDAALADDPGDPRVAPWLAPFGGQVLVALDEDGRYLAGVGLKRHVDSGRELAVVTDERARGRGLARRLVAQAARAVLAQGRVATYLHAPDNEASARVARASGFPDTGWSVLGYFERG